MSQVSLLHRPHPYILTPVLHKRLLSSWMTSNINLKRLRFNCSTIRNIHIPVLPSSVIPCQTPRNHALDCLICNLSHSLNDHQLHQGSTTLSSYGFNCAAFNLHLIDHARRSKAYENISTRIHLPLTSDISDFARYNNVLVLDIDVDDANVP